MVNSKRAIFGVPKDLFCLFQPPLAWCDVVQHVPRCFCVLSTFEYFGNEIVNFSREPILRRQRTVITSMLPYCALK